MPPAISSLAYRFGVSDVVNRHGRSRLGLLFALHLGALAILLQTESELSARVAFIFAWAILNFFWLALVRRPTIAAALSLAMIVLLIQLSKLKQSVLFMTVNFVDLLIIDRDTFSFLFTIFPSLQWYAALSVVCSVPALAALWRFDTLRIGFRSAVMGLVGATAGLCALVFSAPADPYNEFYGHEYVSKFARSGVTAVSAYLNNGLFEADTRAAEQLKPVAGARCETAQRPPHIIMVFDESSFDITAAPTVRVPQHYRQHFRSFDGQNRTLVVEGINGPSWYTEYNVLTGLSVKSYGRFADFVTRIAAGRVERGLPHALRRCGYKTFSLYPYLGAFLSAKGFQESAGIQHFLDSRALGAQGLEPDHFFYDSAVRILRKEQEAKQPLFMLVYTAANHFPWDFRYRPELTPEWRELGNGAEVDEYIRRQTMSARDYRAFVERLQREFPGEPFLIVRFGDHQPSIASGLIDPSLDDSALSRRIAANDPRFLQTYYAIETVNFRPVDLSAALERLDAPYLPLVVLEAAGLPLDPTFAEQKRIFSRCRGLFYQCSSGNEARRFNRLLIDAGLIKGL